MAKEYEEEDKMKKKLNMRYTGLYHKRRGIHPMFKRPASSRFITNMGGRASDIDRDGVPDYADCAPRDPKRDGIGGWIKSKVQGRPYSEVMKEEQTHKIETIGQREKQYEAETKMMKQRADLEEQKTRVSKARLSRPSYISSTIRDIKSGFGVYSVPVKSPTAVVKRKKKRKTKGVKKRKTVKRRRRKAKRK